MYYSSYVVQTPRYNYVWAILCRVDLTCISCSVKSQNNIADNNNSSELRAGAGAKPEAGLSLNSLWPRIDPPTTRKRVFFLSLLSPEGWSTTPFIRSDRSLAFSSSSLKTLLRHSQFASYIRVSRKPHSFLSFYHTLHNYALCSFSGYLGTHPTLFQRLALIASMSMYAFFFYSPIIAYLLVCFSLFVQIILSVTRLRPHLKDSMFHIH